MPRVIAQLQRAVIVIGLLLATAYASVGFVHQERTVRRLTSEVAQRQHDLHDARQEQRTLSAEIAALNDPGPLCAVCDARRAPYIDAHTAG